MAYKAFAPATISNLCSGFDLLGLALKAPGDYVIARNNDLGTVQITSIRGFKSGVSKEENTAKAAVEALLASLGSDQGVDLEIEKGYQHSSGLGSSAASAVAAVIATNILLGKPYKQKIELLPFALKGERFMSSGLPADNVAASLLGGIVLSHPVNDPIILPVPDGLHVIVARPDISISTVDSRRSLPDAFPLPLVTEQVYAMSNLVLGLYRSDWELISRGLRDHLIEPHRAAAIPGFNVLQKIALEEGAFGASISGSGPAIFAICPNSFSAETIGRLWKAQFTFQQLEVNIYVSPINMEGAHLC